MTGVLPADAESTFCKAYDGFLDCYGADAGDASRSDEPLALSVTIGATGEVESASPVGEATPPGTAVRTCLLARARQLRFDKPVDGVRATVSYVLAWQPRPLGRVLALDELYAKAEDPFVEEAAFQLIRSRSELFRKCYAEALSKTQGVIGATATLLVVDPTGSVVLAKMQEVPVGAVHLEDASARQCVRDVYLSLRFTVRRKTVLTHAIDFREVP